MNIAPNHARLMRLASLAALTVALSLALAKGVAWWLSGSVSLLAGLTDSLLDGAASLLNLVAVHYSLRPADDDHRYGHGKAEALAGLGQALFIGASAVLVGSQAIDRLLNPEPLAASTLGVAVMVVSLLLTFALLLFQRYVVEHTGSTAIRADSLHYRSDLLLNSSILVALLLASYGWPKVDAFFAIGIALYIFWSAVSIAREATTGLMDQELPTEVTTQMHAVACAVPGVVGIHDLRTRLSGTHWFVQLHVELPDTLSLLDAHEVCVQVEQAIVRAFPRAEVLIHPDPCSVAKDHTRRAI